MPIPSARPAALFVTALFLPACDPGSTSAGDATDTDANATGTTGAADGPADSDPSTGGDDEGDGSADGESSGASDDGPDPDPDPDPEAICGDGFVDPGEACDLGADNDDQGVCKEDCTVQVCGDGAVGPGEGCDDGNAVDDDGCSNDCALPGCGDGEVDPGEVCDDGNADNTDSCLDTCVTASCGDGFVHAGIEQCDDANADNGDGCLVDCAPASCGDGFVHDGVEACDDGNALDTDACLSTCVPAQCGDGHVQDGVEACDDTINDGSYGGCATDCLALGPYCGDGQPNGPEACDDGNLSDNDACLDTCEVATCGDGVLHVGVEQCDDGDSSNTDSCLNTCVAASCGDGYIWAGNEVCDDQNLDNGDGCNNACVDAGALVWNRTYNGADDLNDFGTDITTDADDNVIVIGDESFQSGIVTWWEHIWIRKYDADGNTMWSRQMSGDAASYDIATDDAGNVIALGTVWLPPGQSNLRIRKYDADGDEQWTVTELSGLPRGLAVDGAGNAFVGGRIEASAWLRKYDPAGVLLWERQYDGPYDATDEINDVATDAAGNVVVVGRTAVGLDDYDAWIRMYSSAGAVLWSDTFASAEEYDAANHVAVDGSGNVYVVADVNDEQHLRKYNAAGVEQWTLSQSSPTLRGVATDLDGNVLVTSSIWAGLASESNFFVQKYDPSGTEIWATEVPGANDDEARGIATDSQGFSVITGYTETANDGHNIWTGKFAP
ncbi:MAG: DUF4215 domain-containing protein [Myxococcota bacterium]